MNAMNVLLLITVVVVAISATGASSVVAESTTVHLNTALDHALLSHTEATRSLRTIEQQGDSEDRGANLNFVTKIKNWFKPKQVSKATSKVEPVLYVMTPQGKQLHAQLKDLLKTAKSTDEAFLMLKLDQAGAKLFQGTNLPLYVRYSELTSKKAGNLDDVYGIETLLRHYKEDDLTLLISAGMKSTDKLTKAAAEQLRSGQYTYWLSNHVQPRDVFQMLKRRAPMNDHKRQIYRTYLDMFNKKYITHAA